MSEPNPDPAKVDPAPTKVPGPANPKADPTPPGNPGDDVNARLLDESQKAKARAQKAEQENALLRKERDDAKAKELAADGKGVEAAKHYQEKYEGLQQTVVKTAVRGAIAEAAAKAGCKVGADKLMLLGKSELLTYDEASGLVSGVEEFIDQAKKDDPFLFEATQTPSINPVVPGGMPAPKGPLTAAQIAKLSPEEKTKHWEATFSK